MKGDGFNSFRKFQVEGEFLYPQFIETEPLQEIIERERYSLQEYLHLTAEEKVRIKSLPRRKTLVFSEKPCLSGVHKVRYIERMIAEGNYRKA